MKTAKRQYRKHSVSRENKRLYWIWANMVRRCTKPTDKSYRHYGGRGIRVCKEWADDPRSFRDWAMATGYTDKQTIDRRDSDGPYSPRNCRWVPAAEQSGNRRNKVVYEAWGEIKPLHDWLKDPRCVIHNRRLLAHRVRHLGWTPERAMGTAIQTDVRSYCARGEARGNTKLTAANVVRIKKGLAAGFKETTLARWHKVSVSTISAIKVGRIWSHVTP
jgi:hypothetical protein